MSRRSRGRITVQSQPTGATRAVRRMAGVVQVIFGLVFVVVAVTQIMPLSPLFSLPFLAMGALAVVMGVLSAVGKNGLPHRVGYDVETGIEEETIAGLMEDVDKTDRPSAGTHDHIPSTALDAGERLKQLEDLKKDVVEKFRRAEDSFTEVTGEEQEFLQKFALICLLSFDVYMKKMIVEQLVADLADTMKAQEPEKEAHKKKN